ncbi:hypothetical protein BDV97DRAFT_42125 [Delphinella strobiligena]|nr:hypothetical protein BDV97DRAFT_42125 [Delphinella strobiligena]
MTSQASSSLRLPYQREEKYLPAPIPSVEEIRSSTRFLKKAQFSHDRKVVRVGDHFVAKYGLYNDVIEGENLLFVEQNLDIPAPKLYAMWKESDGTLYVVMDYIPGNSLESLWPDLNTTDKTCIISKVRAILDQMRALPSPGFFGSVTKSHMPDHVFYWPDYPAQTCGPFQSERKLVMGLISKSRLIAEMNERSSYLADFFENQLMQDLVKPARASIFTHADLRGRIFK